MKKILIIHASMDLGGAETSLLGLLNSLDYRTISVDLFLYERKGELLPLIPEQVNVLPEIPAYKALVCPVRTAVKKGQFRVAAARVHGRLVFNSHNRKLHFKDPCYIIKQWYHKYALKALPDIPGEYDLAISFNDPHFILTHKVNAKVRVGWFHTDFERITIDPAIEAQMWDGCDRIVNVSGSCKANFDLAHPDLVDRSMVVENILSKPFIQMQARAFSVESEMPSDGSIRILSIGRFSTQKNFDNVPDICARIIAAGLNVKWYLIGFGVEEEVIREKIREAGMEDHVFILGKKENPYPYLLACDLYAQPSRYEGKAVSVREAQILNCPCVITRYPTSSSQYEEDVDGVIVPMDNEGCAEGMIALLRDPDKMKRIAAACGDRDYTNAGEVRKLYQLME